MIVDTSAVLAILLGEPEADAFAELILRDSSARMSAASYVEAGIRVDRLGDPVASRLLDTLIESLRIGVEPVSAEQARIAREAYRDFGKGTGHAAQLNFGDCSVYALAKAHGEPILYKGNDYRWTDVPAVHAAR